MSETVRAAEIVAGDEVTLPGSPLGRCRVSLVRSVEPGVVWLYLVDPTTGSRVRGHVALAVDKEVERHGTAATATVALGDEPDEA